MRRVAIATLLVVLASFAGCGATGGEQADYDHQIRAVNQDTEQRSGHLEVLDNETGDVVFERTVRLEPNASRQVFDFESVRDSGATQFWVSFDVANRSTARSYVRMTEHTGDIQVTVHPDDVRIVVED